MFHGCRSLANEESIMAGGFNVSRCVSGGGGFGTWFAYNSSYSNSGYVLSLEGTRHIFVCAVSDTKDVALDNSIMRVVGQDCAYPMWLLTYTVASPPPPSPPRPSTQAAPGHFRRKRHGGHPE